MLTCPPKSSSAKPSNSYLSSSACLANKPSSAHSRPSSPSANASCSPIWPCATLNKSFSKMIHWNTFAETLKSLVRQKKFSERSQSKLILLLSSDVDTRRQAAADFTQALMQQYEQQVTDIITRYVGAYLQQYAANPAANWKSKDTALFLLTSVASRSSSQQVRSNLSSCCHPTTNLVMPHSMV